MNDIEKVVNGLTEVRQNIDCASGSKKVRLMDVVDKAMELLKEQEPVFPEVHNSLSDVSWYVCSNCGAPISPCLNFCGGCGRKVNWDG